MYDAYSIREMRQDKNYYNIYCLDVSFNCINEIDAFSMCIFAAQGTLFKSYQYYPSTGKYILQIGLLYKIILNHNPISFVSTCGFLALQKLISLNMHNSNLINLNQGTFDRLLVIKNIDISLTLIKNLDTTLFAKNINLRTLNMTGVDIKIYDDFKISRKCRQFAP